jgi:hypothetical protein
MASTRSTSQGLDSISQGKIIEEDLEGVASVKRQRQREVSIELIELLEGSSGAPLTQALILAFIAPANAIDNTVQGCKADQVTK